jgi:hypothetical protein
MAVKLSIKKLLNKKNFKLNKKVILKNKFKLALLVFIICVFLIPKMFVPKCVISFMKSLLGKIVCVVVILYIGYKDITYGLMLTVLFGALLYASNNYILENMEQVAHTEWHDRNPGDIPTDDAPPPPPPQRDISSTPGDMSASGDTSTSVDGRDGTQITTQMSEDMNSPTVRDGFTNMEPFYGDVENYQSV